MKRDFIEEFIDKVSVNLLGDTISEKSLNALQQESIAVLELFGQVVPTGYSAHRTLTYFKLRLQQIANIRRIKKKNLKTQHFNY